MPLNNVNDHRPSCSVMFCFNATYSKWNSLDKDNAAGEVLQTYTTAVSYSQLINKSTHCVNSSSYWIDSVFNSNTNLVTDFEVDPTL